MTLAGEGRRPGEHGEMRLPRMAADMTDARELPLAGRLVMVVVLGAILAGFLLIGAVLWASSGDGPCDGPVRPADVECHRE